MKPLKTLPSKIIADCRKITRSDAVNKVMRMPSKDTDNKPQPGKADNKQNGNSARRCTEKSVQETTQGIEKHQVMQGMKRQG